LLLSYNITDRQGRQGFTLPRIFAQAWNNLPELCELARFRAWLFRSATNRGHSWLRRQLIGWVSLEWLAGSSAIAEPDVDTGAALHVTERGFAQRRGICHHWHPDA